MNRIKVKDYSAKRIKRFNRELGTAMDKVADFSARKLRKMAPKRYSKIVTGVDESTKTAYVGFDNAGHYRDKKNWHFSVLRMAVMKNIRGIVSAFRRQMKYLDKA